MFPPRKLAELPPRTRQRKVVRILQAVEVDAAGGLAPDRGYLARLLDAAGDACPAPEAGAVRAALDGADASGLVRAVNGLRHALLALLGAEPSEWDFMDTAGTLDRTRASVLPMTAYLEDIRSPFNVGSLFRTAEALGAERLLLSPRTPSPAHPRAVRTSLGAADALPWAVVPLADLGERRDLFALETGGTPLDRFAFPAGGVVLVGSEELGLSPEALALADRGLGRVSIPMGGAKRSLNVSVAFGILMHAWAQALRGSQQA